MTGLPADDARVLRKRRNYGSFFRHPHSWGQKRALLGKKYVVTTIDKITEECEHYYVSEDDLWNIDSALPAIEAICFLRVDNACDK